VDETDKAHNKIITKKAGLANLEILNFASKYRHNRIEANHSRVEVLQDPVGLRSLSDITS
jgi:hypothetical protein